MSMIRCYINVNYQGFIASMRARGVGKNKLKRFLRFANAETVKLWHERFLPAHFVASQTKYGYQRRKVPYSDIKRKLASGMAIKGIGKERVQRGGLIDIVRSGRTERMARAAPGVRTYPTKAVLTMVVPQAVAMTPRDPSKPRQSTEMTKVTMQETRTLRRYWQSTIKREIEADPYIIKRSL